MQSISLLIHVHTIMRIHCPFMSMVLLPVNYLIEGVITVDTTLENRFREYLGCKGYTICDGQEENMIKVIEDIRNGASESINIQDAYIHFESLPEPKSEEISARQRLYNPDFTKDDYKNFNESSGTSEGSEIWTSKTRGWSIQASATAGYLGNGASATAGYSTNTTTTHKDVKSIQTTKNFEYSVLVPRRSSREVVLMREVTEHRYRVENIKVTFRTTKSQNKVVVKGKFGIKKKKSMNLCKIFTPGEEMNLDGEYVWTVVSEYVEPHDPEPLGL